MAARRNGKAMRPGHDFGRFAGKLTRSLARCVSLIEEARAGFSLEDSSVCAAGARRECNKAHDVNGTAGVAESVDAPDLGSGAGRRGGSSPSARTKSSRKKCFHGFC